MLKEAAEQGDELKKSAVRKQLKYMTNMYRRQIFKINENMNMGTAPSTI